MNEKFDKFTERAQKVLRLSQEEAQRFNHNYIGAEHLLLGLIRVEEGVGAKALTSLGVQLNNVRVAVEYLIGRGERIVLGDIGLTPRAKKVVELAVDEARRLGHHYIGTEHLLLGLIREDESIAAGVLASMGVSLERARSAVIEQLGMRGAAPSPTPPAAEAPGGRQVVSALTLVCRDTSVTGAFYASALGATLSPGAPTGGAAPLGAETLVRLPFGGPPLALRAARPDEASVSATSGIGAVELSFYASDIGALHAELQGRGAVGLPELGAVPGAPNMRMFTLTDPDGRTLRFHGLFKG